MHLSWNTSGLGLVADTEHGEYSVFDTGRMGYGGFGAFFRPAQGRAFLPKDQLLLGNFDTIEKAQARCEQHAQQEQS